MGYYTRYELAIGTDDPELEAKIRAEVIAESGYGAIDQDTIKWYGHDEDLIKVSKNYPDVLFTLDGEGEESGDVWRKYYKNGETECFSQQRFVPPPTTLK